MIVLDAVDSLKYTVRFDAFSFAFAYAHYHKQKYAKKVLYK